MANSMWLTEEQKRRRLWAIIIGVFIIGIILLATIPDWGSDDVSDGINITLVAAQNNEMKNELENIKATLQNTMEKSKDNEAKLKILEQEKVLADKESLNKRILELETKSTEMNKTIISLQEENKNQKAIIESLEDEVDNYKIRLEIAQAQINRLNQTSGTG